MPKRAPLWMRVLVKSVRGTRHALFYNWMDRGLAAGLTIIGTYLGFFIAYVLGYLSISANTGVLLALLLGLAVYFFGLLEPKARLKSWWQDATARVDSGKSKRKRGHLELNVDDLDEENGDGTLADLLDEAEHLAEKQ